MKVSNAGKYLRILLEDTPLDTELLLGWRQRKGDPWLVVENNIVNRIVLGLPIQLQKTHNPPQYTEQLEPYQIADVDKALGLQHYLNANPMGLGKTPETVRYLKEKNARTALIVTPKIIRHQWKHQLKVWGGFDAEIYENQKVITEGIWIINYDKLRTEKTRLKFRRFQWEYLVLDEAHKIKSRTSQQTKAVKELPAAHRIALTGTPILRYVDDLWSILHFLDESYSGISYWAFRDYFCEMQHTPWGDKIIGLTRNPAKVAILNQLMSHVSIRNNAVEVAKGKSIETVLLPMTNKQRELYRKEKDLVLDQLPENLTIANGAVLTMRLMQTTSWPGLYIENEPGPKFEWILETCSNNPKEKFVVFSVFEKTISALVQYLNDNGISAVSITGKNKAEENEINKRLFVDKGVQVLAGTIGSMGQGYDELQHVCRLGIVIDRDWSPEIMEQAEDRLHRKGQDSPVCIYYLECTGSFDQHVGRVNRNKAADIREALNNEISTCV